MAAIRWINTGKCCLDDGAGSFSWLQRLVEEHGTVIALWQGRRREAPLMVMSAKSEIESQRFGLQCESKKGVSILDAVWKIRVSCRLSYLQGGGPGDVRQVHGSVLRMTKFGRCPQTYLTTIRRQATNWKNHQREGGGVTLNAHSGRGGGACTVVQNAQLELFCAPSV